MKFLNKNNLLLSIDVSAKNWNPEQKKFIKENIDFTHPLINHVVTFDSSIPLCAAAVELNKKENIFGHSALIIARANFWFLCDFQQQCDFCIDNSYITMQPTCLWINEDAIFKLKQNGFIISIKDYTISLIQRLKSNHKGIRIIQK